MAGSTRTNISQGKPAVSGGGGDQNYWAKTKDSESFGSLLSGRLSTYFNVDLMSMHITNVSTAYQHVYGLDVEGVGANAAMITRSGPQGAQAELRVPYCASLSRAVHNLVVGPELAVRTMATTTDFASTSKAIVADIGLEYYFKERDVIEMAKLAMLDAIELGEGFLHAPWNPWIGDDFATDGERIVKKGDIDFKVVRTWDVLRDPTARSFDALNWIIVTEWVNKHDIAATAPTEPGAEAAESAAPNYTYWAPFNYPSLESDLVQVFYFYHKRTPAIPNGRQTRFLANGTILEDSDLNPAYWTHLPVHRVSGGEYVGTPFPYTKFWGILASAQAADALYTSLLTNATAVSSILISAEQDSDFPPLELGGGARIIYRSPGKPVPAPLQLQQTHPEYFNLIKSLRQECRSIMGLNDTSLGTPEGANMSGEALSMLESVAVQNNSQLQAKWGKFIQQIGTGILHHIQKNMAVSRQIALSGKNRGALVRATELSGDSVEGVERVIVELGNPISQTAAGKFSLAQMLVQNKIATTPQQILSVLDTGRLDTLTQSLSNELQLIAQENEALSKGEQIPVMTGDDHVLHLQEHRAVTASISARRDSKIIGAAQAHAVLHEQALQNMDPALLKIYNQPNIQPPPPQPEQIPDSTKLGLTSLAVKSGWAPDAQSAQNVFDSGKMVSQLPPQQMPGPHMNPAGGIHSPIQGNAALQQAGSNPAHMPDVPGTPKGQSNPQPQRAGIMPPVIAIKK